MNRIDKDSWIVTPWTNGFLKNDGFSFNGHHCSEFGIEYVPSVENRWQDREFYENYTDEVVGKHGSYYWGSKVLQREFEAECFFEDITRYEYNHILKWIGRGAYGDLEFDSRPHIKYKARVGERIEIRPYNGTSCYDNVRKTYSGTFTIPFIAYSPLGRMDFLTIENREALDDNDGFLLSETGIITDDIMPQLSYTDLSGVTNEILLYNPGSEYSPLKIRISGPEGENTVSIYNKTTDQMCRIVQFPQSGYLEIDSELGRVMNIDGVVETLGFVYHDEEYIQLEPSCPVYRSMTFSYNAGDLEVVCTQGLSKDMEGKFVYLGGKWIKLNKMNSEYSMSVSTPITSSGVEQSDVVVMNEIVITMDSTTVLPMLEFEYLPRFA